MIHRALPALSLLIGVPATAAEVPFIPSAETFIDARTCETHLATRAAAARSGNYVAVEGPYKIAAGDVRIHMVVADRSGHSITEHRCLAEKLSERTWRHAMGGGEAEAPETIESLAAKAAWLKKTAPEKQ